MKWKHLNFIKKIWNKRYKIYWQDILWFGFTFLLLLSSVKITQSFSSFIVMHILSYLLYQHYSFRETLRCSEPGDVNSILMSSSEWSQCPLAGLSRARMGADPVRRLSRPARCDEAVLNLSRMRWLDLSNQVIGYVDNFHKIWNFLFSKILQWMF